MTNIPQPTFGPTGFTAPAEAEIFAGATADINAAFGGNLNPSVKTPQGQLAVSWTAVVGFCYGLFAKITTQFDPKYAEGRMQDGLGRIYFLERNPAQPTVVNAVCSGLPGTVIAVGALATDANGNIYASTAAGTIGADGTVTIPFANLVTGAVACAPNSLTTIYRAVTGWDTINNPTEGVLGNAVESRDAFEQRRKASVALNSLGSIPAIKANVLNVAGVLDAYVTDNPSANAKTVGDVTIDPYALYVSVAGGADTDIAEAIWKKKMPGGPMTGTTSTIVQDTNSGYSAPLPSYTIKHTQAIETPVYFAVTITTGTDVPADAVAQIQTAIINAFAGGDGGERAKIGALLYAGRYYAPTFAVGSWVRIVSIKVGLAATPTGDDVLLGINQIPTITAANITVTAQ